MKTTHSDAKSPGFWLYTADLERDFQILSLPAQGLATRMLCWMHSNELHRGFLELPTGAPMSDEDIAAKVGKPLVRVRTALQELDHYGIFSRDSRGCIYSRRMARETHISVVRRQAAASRLLAAKRAADGTFAGDFAPAKQPPKAEQNPTVTVSVSDSDSDSALLPPLPPASKTRDPKDGWRTDESFQPLVTAYRNSGAACIEEDFADTWWFVWRKLDFEQRLARTKAFHERVERGVYDVPKMIPRFRKFVEQEWKRPIPSGDRKPLPAAPTKHRDTMDPETRATLEQWKHDHPEDKRWQ